MAMYGFEKEEGDMFYVAQGSCAVEDSGGNAFTIYSNGVQVVLDKTIGSNSTTLTSLLTDGAV